VNRGKGNPEDMLRREELWKEYVSKLEDVCGVGLDFIVTLKPQTREEALNKVLAKCRVDQNRSGILTKGRYKNKEVSIFRTGTLLIREFSGREEAQLFLEELFE
jgi:hypothetical protein